MTVLPFASRCTPAAKPSLLPAISFSVTSHTILSFGSTSITRWASPHPIRVFSVGQPNRDEAPAGKRTQARARGVELHRLVRLQVRHEVRTCGRLSHFSKLPVRA